ncbi:threonine synthase [Wenzhouxiangella limi]|uniref:Threonine synthase n=1 Tax=Wenzhouxiangella limi TaxID=2707351 RepID=A0A845V1T0_9GAMM|nr:threonine synthase [Wenzhouxiangella limi]NDY97058.1 threonine synthase [Wenzhouxiangella limi]
MRYLSTVGRSEPVALDTALRRGLAPDGGLYVPEHLPEFHFADLADCRSLAETAHRVLTPFLRDSSLLESLEDITQEALDLPLPLIEFERGRSWMLELFHGPTAAFKDFAARFLAACMTRLRAPDEPVQTIVVATSGDTGGAVAAAFHRRPGFRVVILYPRGRVSARQAHQLGAFGDNVHTFCVAGDFDDCQRLAKRALNDPELVERLRLTSANSISIGRLLPQVTYYAHASVQLFRRTSAAADVIVPTGNLGNALACVLARRLGLPIGEIVLATNANRTLSDYFDGQDYRGRPGLATLANAMDVGDPSNFERLAWFYRDQDLRNSDIRAFSVSDEVIRRTVQEVDQRYHMEICPHTACAVEVLHMRRKYGHYRPHLVAATAHPAKFDEVVEPLLGRAVEPPPALATLLARNSRAEDLVADFAVMRQRLLALASH